MNEIEKFLYWLPTDELDDAWWWLDSWLERQYEKYKDVVK